LETGQRKPATTCYKLSKSHEIRQRFIEKVKRNYFEKREIFLPIDFNSCEVQAVIKLQNQAKMTKICLWRIYQLRKSNFRMCRQSLTINSIFITNSVRTSTKSRMKAEEQTLNFAFETSPSCGWVDMEMKGAPPFNKFSCLICGFSDNTIRIKSAMLF